jgi:formamidopyrimidine-DNA glycosylase
MPELPEVETLRRGLLPLVLNKTLRQIKFFRKDIRFPIPQKTLKKELLNESIRDITRRGKYIQLHTDSGSMIWHLGMSGRVTCYDSMKVVEKHTHAIFAFDPDTFLHFIDPRRFGCILWAPKNEGHRLINNLGLEPLEEETTPKLLKELARGCKLPIKSFLMDAKRIVGVGNIYASESLFAAGIHPEKEAGKITLPKWEKLLTSVRQILVTSIASGGTTLNDFYNTYGTPGYYAIKLSVYGREGQSCRKCNTIITRTTRSGRSTFFCRSCQKK